MDIIVIVGPTGVGKTKLSIELAKKLDAEIINGDSVSIYKKLKYLLILFFSPMSICICLLFLCLQIIVIQTHYLFPLAVWVFL